MRPDTDRCGLRLRREIPLYTSNSNEIELDWPKVTKLDRMNSCPAARTCSSSSDGRSRSTFGRLIDDGDVENHPATLKVREIAISFASKLCLIPPAPPLTTAAAFRPMRLTVAVLVSYRSFRRRGTGGRK